MWLGPFEPNPVWEESLDPNLVFGMYELDWDVMTPFVEAMIRLMPKMESVGFRQGSRINFARFFGPIMSPPHHYTRHLL